MHPDPAAAQIASTSIDHPPLDYLSHLAHACARFVAILGQTAPKARVPTCPDWDADDLLWHLAEVQWFWGTIVRHELTDFSDIQALDRADRPGDRDGLLAFFGKASGDLHHYLSSTAPDRPAWTWSDDQSVGFIRRRQAHEALIHRVDAELTAGDRTPMDADLCTDGVDEALRIMYAGLPPWGSFIPDPTQTVRVQTTDTDQSWLVTLGQFTGTDAEGTAHNEPNLAVAQSDGGLSGARGPAAATVRGAAADLDCWLWHRPLMGQVERSGDAVVLGCLDLTIAQGIS